MKPEEELCRSKFDEFLRQAFPNSVVAWKDGDEPPDYYLDLDGERYAVEVTRIGECVSINRKPMSIRGVQQSQFRFVKVVERNAKKRGLLHGKYIVHMPKPIEDLDAIKSVLRDEIFQYLQATRDLDSFAPKLIFKKGRQSCEIEKLASQPDIIFGPGLMLSKWTNEIKEGARLAIRKALADKRHKLRNVKVPKIILLFDSYLFADAQDFKDCVAQLLPDLTDFYTVFLVSNSNAFVVFSRNSEWFREE